MHIQKSGKKKLHPRHFTAKAVNFCDLMTMSLEDLDQMKKDFREIFLELLNDGSEKLKKHLSLEMKAKRH